MWTTHYDDDCQGYYYYNSETEETTWDRPAEYVSRAEDFTEHYSEEHEAPYFYNLTTKETTWERPPCLDLPTPTPAKAQPKKRISRRLSDTQVNLDNFALSERTLEFFTQLAGLLTCKKTADSLYQDRVQSQDKILNGPDFKSFKKDDRDPAQDGPDTMTVEELREDAREKKPDFDALVRKVVGDQGLDPDEQILVDGEPIVKEWGSFKVLTLAGLKSLERSIAKTENEYGGNPKFLCDLGRAMIVCRTEEEIAKVLLALMSETEVVRIKNRFASPTYTGTKLRTYRGIKYFSASLFDGSQRRSNAKQENERGTKATPDQLMAEVAMRAPPTTSTGQISAPKASMICQGVPTFTRGSSF